MLLIRLLDFIGTIAFSISGTLLGIRKHLDLFGVIFLALTTAVGGGIFRDIIIGNTPPIAFKEPIYCILSISSTILTWIFYKRIIKLKYTILIFDAIGLGAFSAIGANTAVLNNLNSPFIIISMGLITGVGGGILRDVFVNNIPLIFRKEIYAVASILGGLCFYFSYNIYHNIIALYLCFFVTFILRIISIKYNLNLPIIKIETAAFVKNKEAKIRKSTYSR